jgi:hypothetical protein
MIKIDLLECGKHRNETTFRPFLKARHLFREVGIDFCTCYDSHRLCGSSYDIAWVGQASILDKSLEFMVAVEQGLAHLSTLTGPYWIIDGQDSAGLMGTYDVFRKSQAQYLLKNTLYRDRSVYDQGVTMGRQYWGHEMYRHRVPSDAPWDRILLSGANWLSTVEPQFYDYTDRHLYDVFAMFAYPGKANFEYTIQTDLFYNQHRSWCMQQLDRLKHREIARLVDGRRVDPADYYTAMRHSRIVVAPFGYGEIAPRDLEAAMLGAVLIKPDMSHLETKPNIYRAGETYIPCRHDFADLPDVVEHVLTNYTTIQRDLVENMRKAYVEAYTPENLVLHIYDILKQMDEFTTEE